MTILEEQLRLAACFYLGATAQFVQEMSLAVAFIEGPALETTIRTF